MRLVEYPALTVCELRVSCIVDIKRSALSALAVYFLLRCRRHVPSILFGIDVEHKPDPVREFYRVIDLSLSGKVFETVLLIVIGNHSSVLVRLLLKVLRKECVYRAFAPRVRRDIRAGVVLVTIRHNLRFKAVKFLLAAHLERRAAREVPEVSSPVVCSGLSSGLPPCVGALLVLIVLPPLHYLHEEELVLIRQVD